MDKLYIVIVIVIAVLIAAAGIISFFCLPTSEKIKKIKLWLLGAVTEAEKELGAKTGQLKLAKVYGWFIEKFPYISVFISLERFDRLVDDALAKMREMLASNDAIKKLIEGEANDTTEVPGVADATDDANGGTGTSTGTGTEAGADPAASV